MGDPIRWCLQANYGWQLIKRETRKGSNNDAVKAYILMDGRDYISEANPTDTRIIESEKRLRAEFYERKTV